MARPAAPPNTVKPARSAFLNSPRTIVREWLSASEAGRLATRRDESRCRTRKLKLVQELPEGTVTVLFTDVVGSTELTMPVFIRGGKYDGLAPVANLEALERQIPNAHLEFFEGGHLFLREDKKAVERVIAFLQGERDSEDG